MGRQCRVPRQGFHILLSCQSAESGAREVGDAGLGLILQIPPPSPTRHGTETEHLRRPGGLQRLLATGNEERLQIGKAMKIRRRLRDDRHAETDQDRSDLRRFGGIQA